MKKRNYFFSCITKSDNEVENNTAENIITDDKNIFNEQKEDNEWLQEYEIIYQSYCIESY